MCPWHNRSILNFKHWYYIYIIYNIYVLITITCITFASIVHISNGFLCCGKYICTVPICVYNIYRCISTSESNIIVYDTYIHIWFYNWTGNNKNISTCGNCDMIKGIERVFFVFVFVWFGLVCMRDTLCRESVYRFCCVICEIVESINIYTFLYINIGFIIRLLR